MYGLTDKEYNELLQILHDTPNVDAALIYGSRARGDFWRASDIDLSLRGQRLTVHDLAVLDHKLYESRIPYFFYLHIYADIKNPEFKANVDREGKLIYQRKQNTAITT